MLNYKMTKHRFEYVLVIFVAVLFALFLIAYVLLDDARKAAGVVFLYLAVDFMSPQPDVDKIIIIPFIWIPIIMTLGITKNWKKAYLYGVALSFLTGIVFLVLAIWLLGNGAWDRFKDIWSDIFIKSFTTFWGLLFISLFAIVLIIIIYANTVNGKRRK